MKKKQQIPPKVQNFLEEKNTQSYVSQKDLIEAKIQSGIFFIATSVAVGGFLGGREYGMHFAIGAGAASCTDLVLKYFGIVTTNPFSLTAATLGAMGSYQSFIDKSNKFSFPPRAGNTETLTDSSKIIPMFTNYDLAKEVGTAVIAAIASSYAFHSGITLLSDKVGLPKEIYKDVNNNHLTFEDAQPTFVPYDNEDTQKAAID